MIGVAHDPSRASPHARNDPLGPSVAIGDEGAAGGRRPPGGGGASPLPPNTPTTGALAGVGGIGTLPLPLRCCFLNFGGRCPRVSVAPDSIVFFAHIGVGRLNNPLRRKKSGGGLRK